ncbi:hypothetical protein [uncultured Ruegeria sp.]|uniref:hypothetical protein n=1 Tax=uncultured Ruegeria sp. TaxID=259304 RepID=UPI0026357539|nr:hypothetical protein [uncultured Ruegeria sp.]
MDLRSDIIDVANLAAVTQGVKAEGSVTGGSEFTTTVPSAPTNVAATVHNLGGIPTVEIEPGNPASRTSVETALAAGLLTKEQLEKTPQEALNEAPEGEDDDTTNEALGAHDLDELLGEENTDIVNHLVDEMGEDATAVIIGQTIMSDGFIDVDAIRDAMGDADDDQVEGVVNDVADFIDDGRDYLAEQITTAGYDLNMLEQVVSNDPELYAQAKAAFGQFLTDGSMAGVKAVLDKATS